MRSERRWRAIRANLGAGVNPELIEYRRRMCEASLARAADPMTAGELLDVMGSLAIAEGHPPGLVRALTTKQVAAMLKSLERDAGAKRAGERPSGERGRPDPLWLRTKETHRTIPDPPEDVDVAPSHSAPRPPEYTPEQMRVLVDVGDEMFGTLAQFMGQVQSQMQRARERLAEVGL